MPLIDAATLVRHAHRNRYCVVQVNTNGGTYEFRKPVAGVSPFFVGAGIEDLFAMIQLDNIPDLMQLNTNIAGKDITWHTEDDVFDSIGDVDVYVGPEGMAQDSDLAGRFVMKDVPSDVLAHSVPVSESWA